MRALDFTHLLSKCKDYSELYPCVQSSYSQAECKKCVMVVDRSLVEMGGAGPTLSAAYDEDVFAVKGYPQRMQIVYRQGVADGDSDTYHSMFHFWMMRLVAIYFYLRHFISAKRQLGSVVSKMDITSWISSFGQL